MDIKELLRDDEAVSPVIGVILMVAITVILAAVIASFVLGLGDSAGQQAPQVSVECNIENGYMNHTGGDDIEDDRLTIINPDGGSLQDDGGTYTAGDEIIAGGVSEDTSLQWANPDGSDTSIIGEC